MDLINPSDYDLILKHYNMRIPKSPRLKKAAVEEALATKMCKCIKAVQKGTKLDEPVAIAICNKSIFRNRGLKYNRIACKKKYEFIKGKKSGKKLVKTQSKLVFRKTRKLPQKKSTIQKKTLREKKNGKRKTKKNKVKKTKSKK